MPSSVNGYFTNYGDDCFMTTKLQIRFLRRHLTRSILLATAKNYWTPTAWPVVCHCDWLRSMHPRGITPFIQRVSCHHGCRLEITARMTDILCSFRLMN